MKVTVIPHTHSRRGDPVEVGNVYTNPHYKIVIGIKTLECDA